MGVQDCEFIELDEIALGNRTKLLAYHDALYKLSESRAVPNIYIKGKYFGSR